MSTMSQEPRLIFSPGVRWTIQKQGILIVDEFARCSVILAYPEAIIWELLAQGKSRTQILALLELVVENDGPDVISLFEASIDRWRALGLLGLFDDKGAV